MAYAKVARLSLVVLVAPSLAWAQSEVAAHPKNVSPPVPASSPAGSPSTEALHASATAAPRFDPYRYFGLGVDMGISGPLPDAGLLLIGRPLRWIYLHMGATTNFLAYGARGGLTLLNPFFVPLSLTCEAGHFFEGDANTAKHWFSDDTNDIAALHNFSYDYVNVQGGLAFVGRHTIFFVRAGTTWMRASVHNFQRTVYDASKIDVQASDPKVDYRGPSLRLGLLLFL